jgi:hypothetical protein
MESIAFVAAVVLCVCIVTAYLQFVDRVVDEDDRTRGSSR